LTGAAGDWRAMIDDLEGLAARVVLLALEHGTATAALRAGEVSLLLSDDCEIRSLNAAYRGRDKATNVLSFPALDLDRGETAAAAPPPVGPLLLGDIALSVDRLRAEADAEGKSFADHFCHLLVHGTLHLLGYDHEEEADALVMEALEVRILAALRIASPYAPVPALAEIAP
jgi:probable rRNA maturation factor